MILTEHPEVELVQIQLNYVDHDDPGVQSRLRGLLKIKMRQIGVLKGLNGRCNVYCTFRFAVNVCFVLKFDRES
ncbi:MAG: hypothetical protein NC251_13210 [Lachnoclostridium sp.]|nr:hypothetical protein [Lachnospira sp.]MCM1249374.1 hypothetical protein [Lachnoclostridium sp.]